MRAIKKTYESADIMHDDTITMDSSGNLSSAIFAQLPVRCVSVSLFITSAGLIDAGKHVLGTLYCNRKLIADYLSISREFIPSFVQF